jgi:hypothetical protein
VGEPQKVDVFGEQFGGKLQGMSAVYGKETRFMVFEVCIDGEFLSVPDAEEFALALGLRFVPYERGPLTKEFLDQERDRPSLVAIVPDAIREGVVVHPIYEAKFNNGGRWIFKHKHEKFRETSTQKELSPDKLAVLTEANEIAQEWVTPMRLNHVLQKTPFTSSADIGTIIIAMIEDVRLESEGEVVWSKIVASAIGKRTAELLKTYQVAP